ALLSLTPPFGVCALVTSVFFQKDVVAAYLLVGSLLTAAISSAIKRVLKHPRPPRYDDDGDVEYGMPSNHSCFAWFGATFVILYISSSAWKLFSKVWHHLHTSIAIVLFIGIALGCAYSRVYLGYHTANQVTAGSILGCALGVLWYRMFE
ncbi:dolichylpyrophosphate phosphatase, partial [Thalassiosira pseudonana CCMP1335]